MELSGKIRELRESAGMTQEELAGKMGVQRNTVWRWENNKATLSADMFKRLLSLLKPEKTCEEFMDELNHETKDGFTDEFIEKNERILYNYGSHHFNLPATPEGYKAFHEALLEMTKIDTQNKASFLG